MYPRTVPLWSESSSALTILKETTLKLSLAPKPSEPNQPKALGWCLFLAGLAQGRAHLGCPGGDQRRGLRQAGAPKKPARVGEIAGEASCNCGQKVQDWCWSNSIAVVSCISLFGTSRSFQWKPPVKMSFRAGNPVSVLAILDGGSTWFN